VTSIADIAIGNCPTEITSDSGGANSAACEVRDAASAGNRFAHAPAGASHDHGGDMI